MALTQFMISIDSWMNERLTWVWLADEDLIKFGWEEDVW